MCVIIIYVNLNIYLSSIASKALSVFKYITKIYIEISIHEVPVTDQISISKLGLGYEKISEHHFSFKF